MTMLAAAVKPIGAIRAQIDAWVDILDRAEPDRPGWRAAFDPLTKDLARARRIRRVVRLPLVALLLLLLAAHGVDRFLIFESWHWSLHWWLTGTGAALLTLLLIWEFAMRCLFPVLELESRVAALLRYYGAKDVQQDDEALQ